MVGLHELYILHNKKMTIYLNFFPYLFITEHFKTERVEISPLFVHRADHMMHISVESALISSSSSPVNEFDDPELSHDRSLKMLMGCKSLCIQ